MFYNYTNEDFICNWGGVPFKFEAGKVYEGQHVSMNREASVNVNAVTSEIFAHHLANKVLNTPALNTNVKVNSKGENEWQFANQFQKYNFSTMEILKKRALTPPSEDTPLPNFKNELPLLAEIESEPESVVVEEVKKKPGRPAKSKEEPEFEGI